MKKSSKIVFFDNGCRVCRTGALLAGKAGMASDSELNELQTMSAEVSCDLDAVRYCNEIAVYDKETKESRYGIKGMVWFVEDKWGKWVNVFLLPPIYQILNFFYHIFSYNRKMIAPVYEKVENDCKPEFHWGYRLGYIGLAFLIACLSGGFLSVYIFVIPNLIVVFFAILIVTKDEKMEVVGHISSVMLIQILIVMLILPMNYLLGLVELNSSYFIPIIDISCLVFSTWFLYYRRMKYLGLAHYEYLFSIVFLIYYLGLSFYFEIL